jgi:hypothetical protein
MFLLVQDIFDDGHWQFNKAIAVYVFSVDAETECNRLQTENTNRDLDFDVISVEKR